MTSRAWLVSAVSSVVFALLALLVPTAARAQEPMLTRSDQLEGQRGDRPDRRRPSSLPAAESDLPPRGAGTNLALTGAAISGVWYGGALATSFIWPDAPYSPALRIPIAGPWIAMKDLACARRDPNCTTLLAVARFVLATIDGIGQATGLAIAVEALLLPTGSPDRGARSKRARIRPVPFVAGTDGLGIGVAGEL